MFEQTDDIPSNGSMICMRLDKISRSETSVAPVQFFFGDNKLPMQPYRSWHFFDIVSIRVGARQMRSEVLINEINRCDARHVKLYLILYKENSGELERIGWFCIFHGRASMYHPGNTGHSVHGCITYSVFQIAVSQNDPTLSRARETTFILFPGNE